MERQLYNVSMPTTSRPPQVQLIIRFFHARAVESSASGRKPNGIGKKKAAQLRRPQIKSLPSSAAGGLHCLAEVLNDFRNGRRKAAANGVQFVISQGPNLMVLRLTALSRVHGCDPSMMKSYDFMRVAGRVFGDCDLAHIRRKGPAATGLRWRVLKARFGRARNVIENQRKLWMAALWARTSPLLGRRR